MTETAFVNQFWGPGDGGFAVVQQRLRSADATLLELVHFYKERVAIEKEYTKRLARLGGTPLGSSETGSLKIALERLLRENVRQAADSKTFGASVAHHNHDKLAAFAGEWRRGTAKIEAHMQKVLARKHEHWAQLEAAKAKYRAECAQVKLATLLCQTTWGRENEKNEARRRRAVRALDPLRARYQEAVAQYRAVHEAWVRDWAAALASLYLLEMERIQMCKLNCFSYCNHVALLCVAWDLAADSARLAIADVAAPRDIAAFAHAYGTGASIDGVPEFVEFLDGKDEAAVPMTTALFHDPDYAAVLLRTFSVQSGAFVPAPASPQRDKALPEVRPTAPTPDLRPGLDVPVARKLPSFSTYTSEDVFDKRDGSDYSNPTNYTARSWASPRKKTSAAVQDSINRRLRDMTTVAPPAPVEPRAAVPIAKDFSIDFIAKALEDLDAGGNGDVLHLRRSVRARAAPGYEHEHEPRPASDYVDDSREVATRFNLISFKAPAAGAPGMEPAAFADRTRAETTPSALPARARSLLKSPTKSYTNLHALVAPPHYVTKARAKYSYTAREAGELSFRKGWHMYVMEKQEDNWYVCVLADNCGNAAGAVGLVAYNYVVEGDSVF